MGFAAVGFRISKRSVLTDCSSLQQMRLGSVDGMRLGQAPPGEPSLPGVLVDLGATAVPSHVVRSHYLTMVFMLRY